MYCSIAASTVGFNHGEAETVFSRAVDATDPEAKFLSEYTEITKDEFLAAIINDLTAIIDALEDDHG